MEIEGNFTLYTSMATPISAVIEIFYGSTVPTGKIYFQTAAAAAQVKLTACVMTGGKYNTPCVRRREDHRRDGQEVDRGHRRSPVATPWSGAVNPAAADESRWLYSSQPTTRARVRRVAFVSPDAADCQRREGAAPRSSPLFFRLEFE